MVQSVSVAVPRLYRPPPQVARWRAAGDGQSRDGRLDPRVDLEHPARPRSPLTVTPAAGPVIVSVPLVSLSSSWPEVRVIVCGVAKAVGSKVMVVGTLLGVGVEDRLAERAGAAVVGVAHHEG